MWSSYTVECCCTMKTCTLLIHATAWMNLKTIRSEEVRYKRLYVICFHLYEIPIKSKLTEIERLGFAWGLTKNRHEKMLRVMEMSQTGFWGQLHRSTILLKTHRMVYFQWVNCIVHKLYLKKTLFLKMAVL